MNTISKIHKLFSERLRNTRVLENPEEFLGENFEAVLNFWLFLDDLSEEQLRIVKKRDFVFFKENRSEWRKATNLAIAASEEVVGLGYAYEACWVAWVATNSSAAYWTTRELIGMHKIHEDHQKPLTVFQMFLEVL